VKRRSTADNLRVCSMEIEPSDNGGYVVTQRFHQSHSSDGPSPYVEPKRLTFATKAELREFLTDEGLPQTRRKMK